MKRPSLQEIGVSIKYPRVRAANRVLCMRGVLRDDVRINVRETLIRDIYEWPVLKDFMQEMWRVYSYDNKEISARLDFQGENSKASYLQSYNWKNSEVDYRRYNVASIIESIPRMWWIQYGIIRKMIMERLPSNLVLTRRSPCYLVGEHVLRTYEASNTQECLHLHFYLKLEAWI